MPTVPPNPYSTQQMKTNPYPYSVSAAKSLLASHGWTVRPGGASTCARPGTASNECGTGIAAGAKLSFNELVATGSAPFTAEVETMQSSWSLAGIQVTLRQESPGAIYSSLSPCKNGNSGCVWQMANFGSPGETPTYSPEYLPTGGPWFATDGANNVQGYSNPEMDALIAATEVNSSSICRPGLRRLRPGGIAQPVGAGLLLPALGDLQQAARRPPAGSEPEPVPAELDNSGKPASWAWRASAAFRPRTPSGHLRPPPSVA